MNPLLSFLAPFVVVILLESSQANERCEDALDEQTSLCKRWMVNELCNNRRVQTVCARSCMLCGNKVNDDHAKPVYEGCFRATRAAGFRVVFVRGQMSAQSCADGCKKRSYKYAALQNGMFCMCGDDHSKMAPVNKRNGCSKRCAGTNDECGGSFTNSVYRIAPKKRYLDVDAVAELILGKDMVDALKKRTPKTKNEPIPLYLPKKRDWNFDSWLRKFVESRNP